MISSQYSTPHGFYCDDDWILMGGNEKMKKGHGVNHQFNIPSFCVFSIFGEAGRDYTPLAGLPPSSSASASSISDNHHLPPLQGPSLPPQDQEIELGPMQGPSLPIPRSSQKEIEEQESEDEQYKEDEDLEELVALNPETAKRIMKKQDDTYLECYPEFQPVMNDIVYDSDEEDVNQMDQGRQVKKLKPWDFTSEVC